MPHAAIAVRRGPVEIGQVYISNDRRDINRAPYRITGFSADGLHAFLRKQVMLSFFPLRRNGAYRTSILMTNLGVARENGWSQVFVTEYRPANEFDR